MGATKVLVTGAAGFIGSHITDHCLALGMDVVATDNLSGGFIENIPPQATWIQGDLRDGDFVRSLWNNGPFSYVYHAAAYAAEVMSHFKRDHVYRNNLLASANLIQEAVHHHVDCFVFTSSIAVYGENQLPMHESLVPRPEDPYGISKYAVELDLKAAQKMFGLNYIIFRPHNVYGERQNLNDKDRNVVGIFIKQLLEGLPMTVFGNGEQQRAFSYIDDVAPVIAKSPLLPNAMNNVFNIGSDTPCTILQLAEETALALGKPCILNRLPARKEVTHVFADQRKIHAALALPPSTGLKEGLRRMAAWAKKQKHSF